MARTSGLIEDLMLAPGHRNQPAKLGSINIQYKCQGWRGIAHWARPRPQRWRWLKAHRKTANSLPSPLIERIEIVVEIEIIV